jgi:hypothetical protein
MAKIRGIYSGPELFNAKPEFNGHTYGRRYRCLWYDKFSEIAV